MWKIGVLFDIDELGGGLYGYEAYKIFFSAVDTRELAACILSDGDTNATLFGNARQYCIAVQSWLYPEQVDAVRNALSASQAKGLLPLSARFLSDSAAGAEPLVIAGRIDSQGNLLDCHTGWMKEAWEKTRGLHAGPAKVRVRVATPETRQQALPNRHAAEPAKPPKAAMTSRERGIGLFLLIVAFALFQIAIQSTISAKQALSGAVAALDVSLLFSLIASGYVATRKKRSRAWALLGLLNWVGIIIAFCLKNHSSARTAEAAPIVTPKPVKRMRSPGKAKPKVTAPAAPVHRKLRLPVIGPEFLRVEFTPAEEPSGPGTGPFWEAIECSKRDELDRAEKAFLEAVTAGLPPTCESYANCEIGQLALAKGQLDRGIDYLLRCLGGEKKSSGMAVDAAMRLQVIYAEAGRTEEANALAKLVVAANTRGVTLTQEAEDKLRTLVRGKLVPPIDPVIHAA